MLKHMTGCFLKDIGSQQIPKSTIVALAIGTMPGSEGDHAQTAELRQYFVGLAV